MSVLYALGSLSNLGSRPWVVAVILILVITWSPVAQVANAYANAVALATLVGAGCGTAAKYRSSRE
ncbi:hypothetical protein SAMN05216511_3819 [Streptomyces sp. KS_16]|nr:hypothetical protein BX261_3382 [Streptomyces sp. 2321.6]SDR42385.1 hypothetical protein SAMN05216511_3819 [Streptomyces sp. KS_16]SEC96556.1 hypothetical protein SAMN05428940_3384 [Streptomyces sp. 2133.1]SNC69514.1 hypothetical protein SAMN06272741_3376 [Streptomyces sp. 2114.4]